MFLEHFELMFGSEKKTHLRSWENYEKQLKPYRIYNFITSIILNAERCKIAQLVSGRQQFVISTEHEDNGSAYRYDELSLSVSETLFVGEIA